MRKFLSVLLLSTLLFVSSADAATFKQSNTERFVGLSTDTKPTDAFTGSTFFESDTGSTYLYHDTTNTWTLKTTRGGAQDNLELSKGNIPGSNFILKFGENPDIDIASGFEDLWDGGGDYVPPTVTRIHNLVSSAAADAGTVVSSGTSTSGSLTSLVDTSATFQTDSVAVGDLLLNDANVEIGLITAIPSETTLTIAGSMTDPENGRVGIGNDTDAYRVVTDASTGVALTHIEGLDTNLLFQDEFVVLNGVSTVATAKSYLRQFRAKVFASAAAAAVGNITSTAVTDATVSLHILIGNEQTLMAIYTVPSDKNAYIVSWDASLSKKQASISNVKILAGTLDGIGYPIKTREVASAGTSAFEAPFVIPVFVPGGVDIWMKADASADNTGVAAGFDIILVDK